MKKKILAGILCTAMAATMLAACGDNTDTESQASSVAADTTAEDTTAEDTTVEETTEDAAAVAAVDFTQELTAEDSSLATVGTSDCATTWWGAHSETWQVEAGTTKTVEFDLKTAGVNNWDGFVVILQNVADAHSTDDNADYVEYAVVRQDNYGWGEGYSSEDLTTDWDWTTMMSEIYGAHVTVEVDWTNTWAEVHMTFDCLSGNQYHQTYDFETISGNELWFCLGIDCGYIYNLQVVE